MKARTILWGLTLTGGAAFVGRAAIRTAEGPQIDAELFSLVNSGHGPSADRFFGRVTELGSLYAAGAAAGALVLTGERRAAIRALSAAGATWLLGQGAKKLVLRSRPYEADPDGTRRMIPGPAGTSWPSSHPAVLTTFTRVAAQELGLGIFSHTALSALDASVATSRVYLGVHYPSDVVSGLLMGRAVARLWPGGRRR
jgi:membrane-associated phospholipid phosphatase